MTDEGHVELEKAFGLTTFELEIPFVRDSIATTDPVTGRAGHDRIWGAGNIEVSVCRPIYQFVSGDEFFDNTVGAGLELGIPTNSDVSKNTEAVAKIFDSMRLGEHFGLQTIGGYSVLMGPGGVGGNRSFEYGAVLGYNLTRQASIPGGGCSFKSRALTDLFFPCMKQGDWLLRSQSPFVFPR